jgi:hypothetical protein
MIWYIIISFFIALLLWILFAPVIIFLHTDAKRYHVVLPGIIKMAIVPSPDIFYIRGWIFFIPFKYRPFQGKKRKRKEKPEKPKPKAKLRMLSGNAQLIKDAIRSFRIRKLMLDIDTDDFMLNAWLVPAFSMVNGGNIQLRANFEGYSSLILDMRLRLGTLLWIFIRNKYKSFIHL